MFTTALFVLVLAGCAKVKTLPPLDEEVSAEECAVFVIPNGANVKRIDGAKRGLFSSWGAGLSVAATLLVPAGEHTMIFEYSNAKDGWAARNLKCVAEMSAGKMYMLSVTLDEKAGGGLFLSTVNEAASFVRDQIIDMIPLVESLPRPNPKGIVYQVSEIDQTTLDQYLFQKTVAEKKSIGEILLVFLVGSLWFGIILVFSGTCYFYFMGVFENYYETPSLILAIGLLVAGVLLINYNSSGVLFIYLVSSFLLGFGLSRWDFGIPSATTGNDKFSKKDYEGAISDYTDAIKLAPFTAQYFNNRGVAFGGLKEWKNAIADLSEAARLAPNKALYKTNFADIKAAVQDYAGAISDYTEAIKLDPFNAQSFNGRGIVYYTLQDWENALADFTDAVRIAPNEALYKTNLDSAKAKIAADISGTSRALTEAERRARDAKREAERYELEYGARVASRKRIEMMVSTTLASVFFIAGMMLFNYHVYDTTQRSDVAYTDYAQLGLIIVFGIVGASAATFFSGTRKASAGVFSSITSTIGFIGMITLILIGVGSLSLVNIFTVIISGIIGAIAGAIIGAIAGLIHKRVGGFVAGSILGLALLILSLPFNRSLKTRNAESAQMTTATVTSAAANIRSAPDSKTNNIIIQMKKGDTVTVTGSVSNGWLPVEVDGKAGYVSSELVEINDRQ
jgi:tetratricopeptide (TPR) repeat protein